MSEKLESLRDRMDILEGKLAREAVMIDQLTGAIRKLQASVRKLSKKLEAHADSSPVRTVVVGDKDNGQPSLWRDQ